MESLDHPVAPVLVLGVGNVLLSDDGVGPALVGQVQGLYAGVNAVECVDGGTQGLALLGYFAGRTSLVILDAFSNGKSPGEVSVLEASALLGCGPLRSTTAHEGNAGELLVTARLLGELPQRVFLVGIEPEHVRTGLGLSERVAKSLPAAFAQACAIVEQELVEIGVRAVA